MLRISRLPLLTGGGGGEGGGLDSNDRVRDVFISCRVLLLFFVVVVV